MNPTQTPPKLILKMETIQIHTLEAMIKEIPFRYENQLNAILHFINQFVTEQKIPDLDNKEGLKE